MPVFIINEVITTKEVWRGYVEANSRDEAINIFTDANVELDKYEMNLDHPDHGLSTNEIISVKEQE